MLIEKIPDLIAQNKTVALVSITVADGSTPAAPGAEMLVDETGNIGGTVGGGALEHRAIEDAKKCISKKESLSFSYDLKADLGMECGGSAEYFVKIYAPAARLILIGAGHVNHALYKMADILGFDITVIDDRLEIVSKERYPLAKQRICGSVADETEKLALRSSDYVVIATQGHKFDELALANIAPKHPKYLGVIGSRRKVSTMMQNLIQKGIKKEDLAAVYAPVGIALGGGAPAEVALSILSEIILIKNNGSLRHMKL
jgi:xanthine dehydrogenase accessory factor